ncbi:Hypothetical predicted protein [Mytilus galloprovincialis]|uniref:Uncharacterized protein n=1 Tax=Mytilus galloprovincialis TaxID=29158 RepID=A0A8B6BYV9_MYTGA|nr:Hypothetical predicted protein [Mytilus galloprovincialis]
MNKDFDSKLNAYAASASTISIGAFVFLYGGHYVYDLTKKPQEIGIELDPNQIHVMVGDQKASEYVKKEIKRKLEKSNADHANIQIISKAAEFDTIEQQAKDVHLILCIEEGRDLTTQMGWLPTDTTALLPKIKKKNIIVVSEPTAASETVQTYAKQVKTEDAVKQLFKDNFVLTASYELEKEETPTTAVIPLVIFIIAACLKVYAVQFIFSRNKLQGKK